MRNNHLLSILCFLLLGSLTLTSFINKNKKEKNAKSLKLLEKQLKLEYIPSGLVEREDKPVALRGFYMFAQEVSNANYHEFLTDLKAQNRTEDLAIAQVDNSLWNKVELTGVQLYARQYDQNDALPVVNISQEAAVLYCQWLTEKWTPILEKDNYNIQVMLPSEIEWEYAAAGGHTARPYPWGGPYARNSKGCFLAQIKALGHAYGPVAVGKYFPNDYGLYDMSGNIAEMVRDKAIAKGGSWNDIANDAQIISSQPLAKNPYIGFRPLVYISKKGK